MREGKPPLFSIETDQVRVVWSRPRAKPSPVVPDGERRPFGLSVQALGDEEAPAVNLSGAQPPHLFEQTDYTLLVQSKTGAPVRVLHRDPVLLQGLHRSVDACIVHGTINFGTQVGQSRFVVEAGGAPRFAWEVEVLPSKLDYRQDYEALRDDLRDVTTDLVLEYLRATYEPAGARPSGHTGAAAWVLLLQHVAGDLEQALGYVARHPRWGTRQAVEARRADRIRRPDAGLRRAVQRGGGRGPWQAVEGPLLIRECLPAGHGRYTLDTAEHRWLAARLVQLRARLVYLREEEARLRPSLRRTRLLGELEGLQHRLVDMSRLSVLREAAGEPPGEPPLRLLTAPGYREAYRACLLLQQGLHLEGGPLRLELKELHLLYEYWCFLTLVRLAAEITGRRAPLRSLLSVEQAGLGLRLRRGRAQTVTFPLERGRRLDLTYNPRFGGRGYLVPQQPDVLLTVRRADGSAARYILDAKYRLDASPSYRRRYGLPGPPADALNTLHRYRDAIRSGPARRAVVQALALFPFREEAAGQYEKSLHYRLLEEIGVGAIPLLPGSTDHLEAWMRRVVDPVEAD